METDCKRESAESGGLAMTAASREYAESGWREDCLQSLAERLREEGSIEDLSNPNIREAERKRLSVQAADWCKARGMPFDWNETGKIADKAISRYLMNWKDKTPGEDDRSHAFGGMLMKKETSKALQNERNVVK